MAAYPDASRDTAPMGSRSIRRVLPQQYAANDATPAAVLGRDAGGILANDDPRSQTPPLEKLMTLDWAQLKPVVADSFAHGAIEIGVVGDIDEQAAIDAIAATFGALPERRAAFDPRADARMRQFASDRSERTLIHKGPAEQAELPRLLAGARRQRPSRKRCGSICSRA